MLCDKCSQIRLKAFFQNANDYEETIRYIKELKEEQSFLLVERTCELGHHKDYNGCWVEDEIFHIIECPTCGRKYSCYVNTYRGGGYFKKI